MWFTKPVRNVFALLLASRCTISRWSFSPLGTDLEVVWYWVTVAALLLANFRKPLSASVWRVRSICHQEVNGETEHPNTKHNHCFVLVCYFGKHFHSHGLRVEHVKQLAISRFATRQLIQMSPLHRNLGISLFPSKGNKMVMVVGQVRSLQPMGCLTWGNTKLVHRPCPLTIVTPPGVGLLVKHMASTDVKINRMKEGHIYVRDLRSA